MGFARRSALAAATLCFVSWMGASDDAGAQTTTPSPLSNPRPPSPALALPPEPAVPAGCAKPTVAQCGDGSWYKTDTCAKDPANGKAMQAYCTWALLKNWNDRPQTARPGFFPGPATKVPFPVVSPGRRVDRGKNLTPAPSPRAPSMQRFSGSAPRGALRREPARQPRSLRFTPTLARSAAGSYASMQAVPLITQMGAIERDMFDIVNAPATSPLVQQKLPVVNQALLARPSWVSAGAGVSSCEEYAYKRWGDYSAFSWAAKRLGRNHRQVYAIAMDPSSPFFIDKPLKQAGVNEPTPRQLQNVIKSWAPANPFITAKPTWLTRAAATTSGGKAIATEAEKQQITALVAAQWVNGGTMPRRLQAKSDATPLALFKQLKTNLDTKYGDPLDDELADIRKRTNAYLELYTRRSEVAAELACSTSQDLCFRCSDPPSGGSARLPAALQKLRERVTGSPVINPAGASALFDTGSPMSRAGALRSLAEIGGAMGGLDAPAAAAPTMQLRKQKGLPQVDAQLNSGVLAGAAQKAQSYLPSSCTAALELQRPSLQAALDELDQQLTRLLVNELRFGDRGCLADPGPGGANICDWQYADFAGFVPSLFDEDVEKDFQRCRTELDRARAALKPVPAAPAFNFVLEKAPNQALVFPCTQRRDFTSNVLEVTRFLDLNDGEGRFCEANLQNLAIKDQQAAIGAQMTGLPWTPGEGKLAQGQGDDMVLGDEGSLGAYFDYDASWELRKTQAKDNEPMNACAFEGKATGNLKSGIYFFGKDVELLKLTSSGTAKTGARASATFRVLDIDSFTKKTLFDEQNKPVSAADPLLYPMSLPPVYLGGIEYDFWVELGPVPIHVEMGANATAGALFRFLGAPGNNCADMSKPTKFQLVDELVPWVRADAYADASVDAVVASAGVRLDLSLLKVALPVGVRVRNTKSSGEWELENGARVNVDMLSGRLTAYAEIGVAPLAATLEATIYSWDGFHTGASLFGLDKTVSSNTMRVAMAGFVDAQSVTCKCDPSANVCCSNVACLDCKATICAGCDPQKLRTIGQNKYYCALTQQDAKRAAGCAPYVK